MKEAEQTALAEQALSEFEVAYGIKPATAAASATDAAAPQPQPEGVKDLGPRQ
jgi:hypothetical protein